jgi:hypothetical protein
MRSTGKAWFRCGWVFKGTLIYLLINSTKSAEQEIRCGVAADAGVLVAEMVTVFHRTTRELITCLFLFPTHAHLRSL